MRKTYLMKKRRAWREEKQRRIEKRELWFGFGFACGGGGVLG